MRLDRQMSEGEHSRALAPTRRAGMTRRISAALMALVLGCIVANATPALADEYDEDSAGHPLRIIAYVLHPVGVAIDYLLLRPAHWLVSHEPLKTAFGHDD